jgi:hypothetical protein
MSAEWDPCGAPVARVLNDRARLCTGEHQAAFPLAIQAIRGTPLQEAADLSHEGLHAVCATVRPLMRFNMIRHRR